MRLTNQISRRQSRDKAGANKLAKSEDSLHLALPDCSGNPKQGNPCEGTYGQELSSVEPYLALRNLGVVWEKSQVSHQSALAEG